MTSHNLGFLLLAICVLLFYVLLRFPYRNSLYYEIKQCRTGVGRFPVEVLDDLTSRHRGWPDDSYLTTHQKTKKSTSVPDGRVSNPHTHIHTINCHQTFDTFGRRISRKISSAAQRWPHSIRFCLLSLQTNVRHITNTHNHRLTRQTLPLHCSTQKLCTGAAVPHVFFLLCCIFFANFCYLEVVMSTYSRLSAITLNTLGRVFF